MGVAFNDSILVEPVIMQRKTKGAKIQELFDSDVLVLNSPFKTVEDVTVVEVLTHYDTHRKIESNIEKIKNWYNADLSALDISAARLIKVLYYRLCTRSRPCTKSDRSAQEVAANITPSFLVYYRDDHASHTPLEPTQKS